MTEEGEPTKGGQEEGEPGSAGLKRPIMLLLCLVSFFPSGSEWDVSITWSAGEKTSA